MSDKSLRCPHCGTPNEALQSENSAEEPTDKKKSILWIAIGVLAFVILGGLTWWYFTSSARAKNAEVEITPEFIQAVHQYDELYPFSEGLAAVRKDGKYGFINTEGELVIPAQFFGVGGFSEGLACVYDEDYNLSFINRKGETVINAPYKLTPFAYRIAGAYAEGMGFVNGVCHIFATTGSEGNWEDKYIDTNGEEVTEPTDSVATPKSEYIVFTESDTEDETRYGLKDAQGKVILEPIYSYMSEPSNGVVLVRMTELAFFPDWSSMREAESNDEQTAINIYGYVDLKGNKTFTENDYQKIEDFKEDQKKKKFQYQYAEQKRKEEEEQQRRLAQEREWIYGTWTCHIVANDPYLGQLEENSKLIITDSFLQVFTNNRLTYNGSYSIENGQIVYDRRNGSAMVIPIDASSHRLEAGHGNYYTKLTNSSQTQSSNSQSSNVSSQNSQRRYRTPQPFHSELDVKRYLREHTFKYQNNVVKFGDKSVYINGYAQTPPPRIASFSSCNIIVVAGGTTFRIDAQNGTMTDGKTVFVAP